MPCEVDPIALRGIPGGSLSQNPSDDELVPPEAGVRIQEPHVHIRTLQLEAALHRCRLETERLDEVVLWSVTQLS